MSNATMTPHVDVRAALDSHPIDLEANSRKSFWQWSAAHGRESW